MSFLTVFAPSVLLTIVVGLVLLLTGRGAGSKASNLTFWCIALGIHLLWWQLPAVGDLLGAPARWLVSVWIGALLTAVLLIIPLGLYLLVRRFSGRQVRRGGRTAGLWLGFSLAVGLVASLGSAGDPIVREEVVRVRDLPPELDGVRIANIGDVHIGRFIVPDDLERAVHIVNASRVDLLVVTGDLIDDLTQLEATLDALERSRTRPVLAVLGNHDKMGNQESVVSAYRRRNASMDLLINGSLIVPVRKGAIRIVGSDYALDEQGGHILPAPEQAAKMAGFARDAFAGSSPDETIIALSHHPEFFPYTAAHGAALTLASHTHGGQVRFFGRPLIVAYDYMHGPYRLGTANLDVSAGIGHWLPLRIGVPREIVIVTLRR